MGTMEAMGARMESRQGMSRARGMGRKKNLKQWIGGDEFGNKRRPKGAALVG